MIRSSVPLLVFLAFATLSALPATAHDLFLAPDADQLVLFRGHLEADAGHDHGHGEEPQACPAALLTGAAWIDGQGDRQVSAARDRNGWPADTRALLVALSSGFWTKTADGTVNLPPQETDRPLTSWLSYESLKWLAAGADWSQRLGVGEGDAVLELIPLENPFDLGEGDKLTLRLLSGERPIADAVVAYGGKVRGKTDADGRINIRLKQAGTQQMTASWVRPDPQGRCERIVTTTTLQFEMEKR